MGVWCLSKGIFSLLIFMVILAGLVEGVYVGNEKQTLLEIKASLQKLSQPFEVHDLLSTWVDHGTTDGEYCEWEGIKCDTTSGYVTDLSLSDVYSINFNDYSSYSSSILVLPQRRIWPLNFSLFLHFKELRSLDLSRNYIANMFVSTGVEWLSSLKKLEILNLNNNYIETNIFPSLSHLTSLKTLDISYNTNGRQDISEFPALENLEVLDLTGCGYYGALQMQGTMSNLLHLNLGSNNFDGDIMMSMASFPSLRFLSLENSNLGGRLFANELPNLPDLEVLILSGNDFDGTLPLEALASFHHLEVLDLSHNSFVGSIPSTIKSLSSLKVISLAHNKFNGSLACHGFCELKNLHELDLSENMFDGNLCECFQTLSSLKLLDVSSNAFTGILSSSLIANLTYLEYVDFSRNKFEGSFSFSSFSNHTKLEVVKFESNNDKFEVQTEEPMGWIPVFHLEVLVLSNCNINRPKGSVLPGFLVSQHKLRILDMSHNSMQGQFPSWLIKNNTMLEVLNLRNNLFCGIIMLFYTNHNIRILDISENHITGAIPRYIAKFLPNITHLDLSRNYLGGVIPSSVGDLDELQELDLSHNKLSGEVPNGLFTNRSALKLLNVLKLSDNRLHGEVLSQNLSLDYISRLHLDNNRFTGKVEKLTTTGALQLLDISNNYFTGLISGWISNMSDRSELVLRNNSFEGSFPCVKASFSFLDISENYLSGPIPSCLIMQDLEHLHLGSNKFTGSIPNSFLNMTNVLTLDVRNNNLSGRIPKFLGELSNLRILLLGNNYFNGSIPKQLCQLTNISLLDLSSNSLSGSIPSCLHNINGPHTQVFELHSFSSDSGPSFYNYKSVLSKDMQFIDYYLFFNMQDDILFTTKTLSLTYKGDVLDIMSGLDLSCNKLTGYIPEELGLLSEIRVLNLSHNVLTGPIPFKLSNLANIESLDLSSNVLTGKIPVELLKLNSLAVFNVSYNNLSGSLPEMKAQFSTFTKESYKGNPLLCGPPLDNNCTIESHVTRPSNEEGIDEEWYDIDMASFYGSCGSTWFVFMLGFAALLYINSYWRRRWLYLVEECMYTCYFFLYDLARKSIMLFTK